MCCCWYSILLSNIMDLTSLFWVQTTRFAQYASKWAQNEQTEKRRRKKRHGCGQHEIDIANSCFPWNQLCVSWMNGNTFSCHSIHIIFWISNIIQFRQSHFDRKTSIKWWNSQSIWLMISTCCTKINTFVHCTMIDLFLWNIIFYRYFICFFFSFISFLFGSLLKINSQQFQ